MKRVMTDQVKAERVSDEAEKKKGTQLDRHGPSRCLCVVIYHLIGPCHLSWNRACLADERPSALACHCGRLSAHVPSEDFFFNFFFFTPQSIDHDTEVLKSSVKADVL